MVVVIEALEPALHEMNPPVARTCAKVKAVVELGWITSELITLLESPAVPPEATKETHTEMAPPVVLQKTISLMMQDVAPGTVYCVVSAAAA